MEPSSVTKFQWVGISHSASARNFSSSRARSERSFMDGTIRFSRPRSIRNCVVEFAKA